MKQFAYRHLRPGSESNLTSPPQALPTSWATTRKHLSDVDVAAAGGWKHVTVLKKCYQQPDLETMIAVVEGGRELQEKQA